MENKPESERIAMIFIFIGMLGILAVLYSLIFSPLDLPMDIAPY